MILFVDAVLLYIFVLPDPDSVFGDGPVVDFNLLARLEAVGLAQHDVTRVLGEDAEEGRGGRGGRCAASGGGQQQEGERGFHCDCSAGY